MLNLKFFVDEKREKEAAKIYGVFNFYFSVFFPEL